MESVKKNLFYNTVYQLLLMFLPLITTPYISRVIGAEGIGIYSYSNSIAYYFVAITLLGLNNYGNRTIAMVKGDKDKLSKTFCEIYVMQLITGVISITFFIFIGFKKRDLALLLQVFYVLSSIFDINWFYFGLEKFKLTVTRNIIIKLSTAIFLFLFIKESEDVYLYVFIMSISTCICQFITWPFLKNYIDFKKIVFSDVLKHFKPNLILFIPVIAISLYRIMDKVMIGYMTDVIEVGFYENADKLINVPLSLITALGTVMIPRISHLIANGKKEQSKRYFKVSIIFVMFISSAMSFGIIAISKQFIPIFLGDGFEKCIPILYILMISTNFQAITNVIRTQYLLPNKRDDIYLISALSGAVINLGVNFILIPRLGAIGAAIATLITEIVVCLVQSISAAKNYDLLKYIKLGMGFIFIGISMLAMLTFFPSNDNSYYDILIKIIVGASYYISCSYIYLKKNLKWNFKLKKK